MKMKFREQWSLSLAQASLICKDAETAKRVTFHPQIRARSITLDGDIYDPEGTLSGGSRNTKNSLLIDIQTFNAASKRLNEMELELKQINSKIAEYEQTSQKTKSLQNELNLATHKLSLAKKSLAANSATQIIRRNNEISDEISSCTAEINRQTLLSEEFEQEIIKIQKDMEEFNQDKGSKLRELKEEITNLSKKIEEQDAFIEKKFDLYQNLQLEKDQLTSDISASKGSIEDLEQAIKELENTRNSIEDDLSLRQTELNQIQNDLNEEKTRLLDIDDEIRELESLLMKKNEQLSNSELELQKLTHELNKFKSSTDKIEQRIES